MPFDKISASDEDYLRAIYDAGGHHKPVATGDVAGRLSVTPGRVTAAFKRLHEKGLVTYRRYRGAELTSGGQRRALEMVRHHRLIERFLVEFLDYDWNDVHEEADRLEHVMSEEMERRIAAKVSDPTTDPHGDAIPNEALDEITDDALLLSEVSNGTEFVVARVSDRNREILRYLEQIKLVPGVRGILVRRMPFDGPILVQVDGIEVAVGRKVSDSVYVRTS
ncbi:MAG: DtxR family transcriptional regulator [Chloroflexi bacterium]|nr:DtxR family transcriptional regulator [Chloroflexota bacterium]HCU73127.1 DtxR family transcriptional regulator [Chloroflexota bacterium]